MRLQRLFRMAPAEIACRSIQEACKATERVALGMGRAILQPPCLFDRLQDRDECREIRALFREGREQEAAERLLRRFHRFAPGRFFRGVSDGAVGDLLAVHHQARREELIAAADAVAGHRFSILGYGRLDFGSPPDWHLDPVAGKRAPLRHWSRLDPLDREQVGDSKVVWELNRHQWMLELGQAWRYTGNDWYASVYVRLLQDWMRHNPPGRGINWSSALEVSLRLISWCWALMLFRGAESVTPSLFAQMAAWISTHANFVERYLSYYFSPNTHLTGEALGLYYAGCLFPELQGAARWRRLGKRILIEQLKKQVDEDGVYFEQSTRYQYYTVEIYLHFLILAERNGDELPAEVRAALQRLLDFLLALRRPDGSLPQIGDADGGWLLPLLRRDPGDYRALFACAAVLFQRDDYARAAGRPQPEALWLLGSPGWSDFPAVKIRRAPLPEAQLRVFPRGGYAVMRGAGAGEGHQLILDAGPIGTGGHGHADLLSLQCSAFGESFIVDPGTGCYTAEPEWRNYFRSSQAHSTLTVDGRSQAEPSGPFSWRVRPAAKLLAWKREDGNLFLDACHGAYRHLDARFLHRRRIVFVQSRYWVVVDDLSGRGRHSVDLHYQFAPLDLAEAGQGWLRAQGSGGASLWVKALSAQALESRISCGDREPLRGWVSADYGRREPAPSLSWTGEAHFPLRIVTLLQPLREGEAPPCVAAELEGAVSTLEIAAAGGADREKIVIASENISVQCQSQ